MKAALLLWRRSSSCHFQLYRGLVAFLFFRHGGGRFGLVRVREHAEEIAFYRGEKGEKEVVKGLLEKVPAGTFCY